MNGQGIQGLYRSGALMRDKTLVLIWTSLGLKSKQSLEAELNF